MIADDVWDLLGNRGPSGHHAGLPGNFDAAPRGAALVGVQTAAAVFLRLTGCRPVPGGDQLAELREMHKVDLDPDEPFPVWLAVREGAWSASAPRQMPWKALLPHVEGSWLWMGQFTPGRWVRWTPGPTGAPGLLEWDTGTGRPSGWIGLAIQDGTTFEKAAGAT